MAECKEILTYSHSCNKTYWVSLNNLHIQREVIHEVTFGKMVLAGSTGSVFPTYKFSRNGWLKKQATIQNIIDSLKKQKTFPQGFLSYVPPPDNMNYKEELNYILFKNNNKIPLDSQHIAMYAGNQTWEDGDEIKALSCQGYHSIRYSIQQCSYEGDCVVLSGIYPVVRFKGRIMIGGGNVTS